MLATRHSYIGDDDKRRSQDSISCAGQMKRGPGGSPQTRASNANIRAAINAPSPEKLSYEKRAERDPGSLEERLIKLARRRFAARSWGAHSNAAEQSKDAQGKRLNPISAPVCSAKSRPDDHRAFSPVRN
ncbi:hypothetical protein MTO96_001346 [Rhipicephalus appendiculatus]